MGKHALKWSGFAHSLDQRNFRGSGRHLNVKAAETLSHTPHPDPAQGGLWAHSHDPEHDLMKRYVVESQTPSGWLGVKSFDDTDSLAGYLWNGPDISPVLEFSTYRIFDQKLGRAL